MPTAQSIVDKALGALGRLQEGEASSGAARTRAIEILNTMLDRWNTSKPTIPFIAQTTHTLTPGTGSYTIGTAQTINITRPVDINDTCFVRLNDTDYPVDKVSRDVYAAIGDKSVQGIPRVLYYDTTAAAVASIRFWPVPDQAYVAYIDYTGRFSSYATETTDNTLMPGQESAIWMNLAIELWPFYPNPLVYANLLRMATLSRKALTDASVSPPVLRPTMGGGVYDANSDSVL